jgi:hypothetical protein
VKDRLEGKLHELVCSGQLDLKTAQQAIAADWIGAYKFYVINPPISRVASPTAARWRTARRLLGMQTRNDPLPCGMCYWKILTDQNSGFKKRRQNQSAQDSIPEC